MWYIVAETEFKVDIWIHPGGPGPEFVISAEPLSPGSHSFLVEVSSPGGQNGLSGNLFEVVPGK